MLIYVYILFSGLEGKKRQHMTEFPFFQVNTMINIYNNNGCK